MKILKSYELYFQAKTLEEELRLAKADLMKTEDEANTVCKLYNDMEARCLYTLLDLLEDVKEEAVKRCRDLTDEVGTIEEAVEHAWKLYEAMKNLEDIWGQG